MTVHVGVANKRGWVRIGKHMPPPFNLCPICQHDHWCMFQIDESAVICGRIDVGYDKDLGEAGFLFRLKREGSGTRFNAPPQEWWARKVAEKRAEEENEKPRDFAAMSRSCEEALSAEALTLFGNALGVSGLSLMLLGAGWVKKGAFSFPMKRASGQVVGIRLRSPDGRKYAVKGSKAGLFLPSARVGIEGPLVVCEGPTDTAAMIGLGFDAVGRPSCRGNHDDVLALAAPAGGRAKARDVVLLADDDGPGLSGAASLADSLYGRAKSIKIVTPQGRKDAREWVNDGADKAAVDAAIANAWYYHPEEA